MMKNKVLQALAQSKDDARYLLYVLSPTKISKRNEFREKPCIEALVKASPSKELIIHPEAEDVLILSSKVGISRKDIAENIFYPTTEIDGFENHTDKNNKYHNVFIKLDKRKKLITFKLGDSQKELKIIDRGSFVFKPHKDEFLICESLEKLDKYIHDEIMNPRMVVIGREILGIPAQI
jgi:hypothetical protein